MLNKTNKNKVFDILKFYNLEMIDTKYNKDFDLKKYKKEVSNFFTFKDFDKQIIINYTNKNFLNMHKNFLDKKIFYYYGERGIGKTMFSENSDRIYSFIKLINSKNIDEFNIDEFKKSFIIIDAINEMTNEQLKKVYNILEKTKSSNFFVIVTGTTYNGIKKSLKVVEIIEFNNKIDDRTFERLLDSIGFIKNNSFYSLVFNFIVNNFSNREIINLLGCLDIMNTNNYSLKSNTDIFLMQWRALCERMFNYTLNIKHSNKIYWNFFKKNFLKLYEGLKIDTLTNDDFDKLLFIEKSGFLIIKGNQAIIKDYKIFTPLFFDNFMDMKNIISDDFVMEWYYVWSFINKNKFNKTIKIEEFISFLKSNMIVPLKGNINDVNLLNQKNINSINSNRIIDKLIIATSFMKENRTIDMCNINYIIDFNSYIFSKCVFSNYDYNNLLLKNENLLYFFYVVYSSDFFVKDYEIIEKIINLLELNDQNYIIIFKHFFINFFRVSNNEEINMFLKKYMTNLRTYKSFIKFANLYKTIDISCESKSHNLKEVIKNNYSSFYNTLTYKYCFENNLHSIVEVENNLIFGPVINIENNLIQNLYLFTCDLFQSYGYKTYQELIDFINEAMKEKLFKLETKPKIIELQTHKKLNYLTTTKKWNDFDWDVLKYIDFNIKDIFLKNGEYKYKNYYTNTKPFYDKNLNIDLFWFEKNYSIFKRVPFKGECFNKRQFTSNINFANFKIFNKCIIEIVSELIECKAIYYGDKFEATSEKSGISIDFSKINIDSYFKNIKNIKDLNERYNSISIYTPYEYNKNLEIYKLDIKLFDGETFLYTNHEKIDPENYSGEIYNNKSIYDKFNNNNFYYSKNKELIFYEDIEQLVVYDQNIQNLSEIRYFYVYSESFLIGDVIRIWYLFKYDLGKLYYKFEMDTDKYGVINNGLDTDWKLAN